MGNKWFTDGDQPKRFYISFYVLRTVARPWGGVGALGAIAPPSFESRYFEVAYISNLRIHLNGVGGLPPPPYQNPGSAIEEDLVPGKFTRLTSLTRLTGGSIKWS